MGWETLFANKLTTPADAVRHVKSGQRVYVGGGAGVPVELVKALSDREDELRDVEVTHILTFADAPYARADHSKAFRVNALFIGGNVREAVHAGRADFTPVFLSEIPRLFRQEILPLDVAIISLSPPDEHGFCSFGVEVGVTKPAAETATLIIAEINQQMPRTLGDSFIHVSRLDHIVKVDYPLPYSGDNESTPEHLQIGQHIAELIPNGATLQMGIGSIPNAVLQSLDHHKDLGVHTEMFSDGVVDLVERGIINCARKNFHPGKIIGGFLFGSPRLYDFVDNNPLIELHPIDYVNDPFNIARNDQMVAINSAVQIDLTGQVCADSIGPKFYSGVGGQVDFIRGAARSTGGVPIIACQSTARGGEISRIVATLYEGSGVVTSRNDVHYVVTEYGVAPLYGRSIRQRVHALIGIAHPKFRERLLKEAHNLGFV